MNAFVRNSFATVCLTLTIATLQVEAAGGRDFAGFYEISDVVENGDATVTLNFTADVFNYSGFDVAGTVVVLADSLLLSEYASATDIWIYDRDSVRIGATITIPDREYELWLLGACPYLYLDVQDATGVVWRQPVELVEMPLGE